MTDSQIKFYDGDYEIIFSKVFNIYENKLVINPFEGFEITFQFSEDLTKKDTSLEIKGDDINKKLLIRLTNFNNTLGIGTTNKMLILKDDKGKNLFFSLHVKSLNTTTSFKQISITFYRTI